MCVQSSSEDGVVERWERRRKTNRDKGLEGWCVRVRVRGMMHHIVASAQLDKGIGA